MLGSLSDSLFPEKDTKQPVRHKVVIFFFSTAFSFLWKTSLALPIPSSLPHPHPRQSHFLPKSCSPADTHFSSAPHSSFHSCQPGAHAQAARSWPDIPPSLSSLDRAGMANRGHLGGKAGSCDWGGGLNAAHLALSCWNHFKYDFLLLPLT